MITYIRHFVAVGAGGLAAWIASLLGLDAETQATMTEQVTTGISMAAVGVWMAVYAGIEKFGKRFTGEE